MSDTSVDRSYTITQNDYNILKNQISDIQEMLLNQYNHTIISDELTILSMKLRGMLTPQNQK